MANDKHQVNAAALMQTLYWWGIPTLFRCPHDSDARNCDIALVGVPHSAGNGSTEKDQHLGPRAVRDVSAQRRRMHGAFRFDPWNACRINDLGDVPLPEANDNEKSIDHIAEFYKAIDAAGANPVSIGGDHSITGAIVSAIAGPKARVTRGGKAALLHFDAHTDSYHNIHHWLGSVRSAAHWASNLVREGYVDPELSVQIGIRGHPPTLDWLRTSQELGYKVITKAEHELRGDDYCVDLIKSRVGDAPLYITFDLDCLDCTVAPGVSNLEPAHTGFSMKEVTHILQAMRGKNVIGGDVVCLMPTKDLPNRITAYVAASIMFEIICLIADRRTNGTAKQA